uniref:Uncharacterized protein n=1 Tax=Angiostrongylus cantonensis TaxID=6313 RepID=A0A0K0DGJ6_ANGCA
MGGRPPGRVARGVDRRRSCAGVHQRDGDGVVLCSKSRGVEQQRSGTDSHLRGGGGVVSCHDSRLEASIWLEGSSPCPEKNI